MSGEEIATRYGAIVAGVGVDELRLAWRTVLFGGSLRDPQLALVAKQLSDLRDAVGRDSAARRDAIEAKRGAA